jgi:hypothetical protein
MKLAAAPAQRYALVGKLAIFANRDQVYRRSTCATPQLRSMTSRMSSYNPHKNSTSPGDGNIGIAALPQQDSVAVANYLDSAALIPSV